MIAEYGIAQVSDEHHQSFEDASSRRLRRSKRERRQKRGIRVTGSRNRGASFRRKRFIGCRTILSRKASSVLFGRHRSRDHQDRDQVDGSRRPETFRPCREDIEYVSRRRRNEKLIDIRVAISCQTALITAPGALDRCDMDPWAACNHVAIVIDKRL